MEKIYIYNNVLGFTEIEMPTAKMEINTMVSTFKDIKTILDTMDTKNKKECAEKTIDIIETIKRLEEYYAGDELIIKNIHSSRMSFELNLTINGASESKNWDITARGARNSVYDLSRAVVYEDNRFFHLLNPEQDIYEYNGKKFYMWDGWHSSLKVMQEIADKKFNL